MSEKIILKGHITVPASQLDLVRKALEAHIRLTREEEGCLVFNVDQREDEPLVFDVYEEFVNQEAFDIHQASVQQSNWGAASKDVLREYRITSKG